MEKRSCYGCTHYRTSDDYCPTTNLFIEEMEDEADTCEYYIPELLDREEDDTTLTRQVSYADKGGS